MDEIDSVKLYKCTVELGSGVTKQVMAGLKQHMAKGDLLHSLVVVITNLKAAKLAGEASEAMILAAQAPVPDAPNGELVKVLQPPGQRRQLHVLQAHSTYMTDCDSVNQRGVAQKSSNASIEPSRIILSSLSVWPLHMQRCMHGRLIHALRLVSPVLPKLCQV